MNSVLIAMLLMGCGPTENTSINSEPADCTEVAFFPDQDRDGYGSGTPTFSCTAPEAHSRLDGDCDDGNPSVHPTREDGCDDLDNDCDDVVDEDATFQMWFEDLDEDGFGSDTSVSSCAPVEGHVPTGGDCDDADPEVFPDAPQRCNGIDDSCTLGTIPADEMDSDGDGILICAGDCDDANAEVYTGAVELCDGLDNDCDGDIGPNERDDDLDGYTECDGDCDDDDLAAWPGGVEVTADGRDGDCDGFEVCFFDADDDGDGGLATINSSNFSCDGANESATTTDCDDLDGAVSGIGQEVPWDGLDNDCDPSTPDDDLDGDGYGIVDDCDDTDPLVNPAYPPDQVYTDVTASAGLDTTHWDVVAYPSQCGMEIMGGGAAAADYDNDGDIDLFLPRQYEPDRLYQNQGDGTFVDVAIQAGIDHAGTSSSATWVDVNADGLLDLFVASIGTEPSRLYLQGMMGFTESAFARGIDWDPTPDCGLVYGTSAADIDGDGDLDLHTDQWHPSGISTGDGSRMWINDGTGFFVDGTAGSGVDLFQHAAFTSAWADFDSDGDFDLAIAGDWGQSSLWDNDGAGVFTDITVAASVGTDENGMGADVGDIDGDGDLDWFVTAIYDTRDCTETWGCTGNRLYLNDGTGSFTDGTDAAGVRDGAWGWGAAMMDWDNDGDLDIVHTNGFPDPHFTQDSNRVFENDGTGAFTDRACTVRANIRGQGRALIPFDFDNDGDLDLLNTIADGPPVLLRNDGGDTNSWLRVTASEPGNPFGVGAQVWVTVASGDLPVRRDIHANNSYVGQRPMEAHFGLGGHETDLFEVRVVWPDGAETVVGNVGPRQILDISR